MSKKKNRNNEKNPTNRANLSQDAEQRRDIPQGFNKGADQGPK